MEIEHYNTQPTLCVTPQFPHKSHHIKAQCNQSWSSLPDAGGLQRMNSLVLYESQVGCQLFVLPTPGHLSLVVRPLPCLLADPDSYVYLQPVPG